MCFDKQTRFKEIKRLFPTAHLEMAAHPEKAWLYCQKPETRLPDGRRGCSSTGPKQRGGPNPWAALRDRIRTGASWDVLTDEFVELYARYESGMRKLYEQHLTYDKLKPIERVVILFGPPDTGKSFTVESFIGGRPHFRCVHGKWFDGYAYERILWIDDFQPLQFMRSHLLQLLGEGHFRAEIKGGMVTVHVEEIYITSNFPPETWYPEKEESLQLERSHALYRRARVGRCDKPTELNPTPEAVVWIESVGNTGPTLSEEQRKKRTASIMDFVVSTAKK